MLETVSFETLSSAYKAEEDPKVRERILMIKMLKEGKTSVKVGSEFCCSHAKVLYWKRRFEEGGMPSLKTRKPLGRTPKVPKKNLEEVRRILEESEWWTTKTVRELIHEKSGVLYSERQIQRLLHTWGYDLIRPSKRHVNKASKKEVENFKKGLKEPSWRLRKGAGTWSAKTSP